jgi:PilZ domain
VAVLERRRNKRYNKRLKVAFGEKDFTQSGFTGNVSSSGLFIIATTNVKVGSKLHLQIDVEGRPLYQEAMVARLNVVPPELRTVVKGGFGVRFLTQRELLAEMIPNAANAMTRVMSFDTAWKLAELYEKEIKRGGVFLWSDTQVALDTVIPIEFELGYANHAITLQAKVVTVVPNPDGKFGLACMFIDGAEVAVQFQPYLPKVT